LVLAGCCAAAGPIATGADGKALWATAIQSADTYVQPYCGLLRKEIAVRGGRGFAKDSGDIV
jgi:hypothetical protein